MSQLTVMTGPERRRRWSAVERERILAAADAPGAIVAEVARRWDVSTSLIFNWRRAAQDQAPVCGFAPVLVESETIAATNEEGRTTFSTASSVHDVFARFRCNPEGTDRASEDPDLGPFHKSQTLK